MSIPRSAESGGLPLDPVTLSSTDRAQQLHLSADLLELRGNQGYRTCRSTHGVVEGQWFCEVEVLQPLSLPANTRLGWASADAPLQAPVGHQAFGYGYRDLDGSKVHKSWRDDYGSPYGPGDVVGLYIHLPPLSQMAAEAMVPKSSDCTACVAQLSEDKAIICSAAMSPPATNGGSCTSAAVQSPAPDETKKKRRRKRSRSRPSMLSERQQLLQALELSRMEMSAAATVDAGVEAAVERRGTEDLGTRSETLASEGSELGKTAVSDLNVTTQDVAGHLTYLPSSKAGDAFVSKRYESCKEDDSIHLNEDKAVGGIHSLPTDPPRFQRSIPLDSVAQWKGWPVGLDPGSASFIKFFKNGADQGVAFERLEPAGVRGYLVALSLFYGARVRFNPGPQFRFPPTTWLPFRPLSDLSFSSEVWRARQASESSAPSITTVDHVQMNRAQRSSHEGASDISAAATTSKEDGTEQEAKRIRMEKIEDRFT